VFPILLLAASACYGQQPPTATRTLEGKVVNRLTGEPVKNVQMMNCGILESPVKLDLKQPVTIEDVRSLIGSVEDDRSWQLVITYRGIAYICDRDEVRHRQPPRIREYPEGVEFGDPQIAEDWAKEAERDEELLRQGSDFVYIRFESYCEGNGYVGSEAAKDHAWAKKVYDELMRNWPKPAHGSTYVDF